MKNRHSFDTLASNLADICGGKAPRARKTSVAPSITRLILVKSGTDRKKNRGRARERERKRRKKERERKDQGESEASVRGRATESEAV